MAFKFTEAREREAVILQAALRLVRDNGGEMKYADIKEELPKVFKFNDKELAPKNTWGALWHTILGMIGGIELKQTGFVDIKKSVWTLTEKGKSALLMTPEEFYKAYHFPYLDILRAKRMEKEIAGNDNSQSCEQSEAEIVENAAETDIETIREKAREQIRQYIRSRTPYQFQDMVAALFRAMGYFTPFVAPKGRDGGIDVIAYCDPLGVKKPHIKIQVKHYPSNPIAVDVVRSVNGLCRVNEELGFVVTSGSFTNEAQREARSLHTNIRLIDGEEFIDLWLANYNSLPEEDKTLMPITPIYYLNTQN